jgi:hypothetical protein
VREAASVGGLFHSIHRAFKSAITASRVAAIRGALRHARRDRPEARGVPARRVRPHDSPDVPVGEHIAPSYDALINFIPLTPSGGTAVVRRRPGRHTKTHHSLLALLTFTPSLPMRETPDGGAEVFTRAALCRL